MGRDIMSNYGLFEADDAKQREPRAQARTAARKLDTAINVVRKDFGRFLIAATGIDEFEDRWHYSKHDIRKTVEAHVFPNTGTMRRIQNAMKADWKLAHPYKVALSHGEAGFGSMPEGDHDHRNQHLEKTYHPSDGNLIPEGDFEGWKDSVDQGGPEKVQNAFTPGGDSGSDRHARRTAKDDDDYDGEWCYGDCSKHEGCPRCDGPEEDTYRDKDSGKVYKKESAHREAAMLVADIYTDFARSAGLRVASLDTLDAYAATGIHEADYRLLQSMIVATAADDCDAECDDDDSDDDEGKDSDSEAPKKAPSSSESDEDDEDDDEDDAPDFGGESDSESESDDAPDFGGDTDDDGDHDDADHHADGGGQSYTVPEQAPEMDPQMLNEIPHDDTDGSAPIPPEVVDSLLGLPPGTIEQLLLQEVEQGQGGGDGFGGPPQDGPPPGDDQFRGDPSAPEAGGDDFFGEGGDDPEQEPPRVARRRQAADTAEGRMPGYVPGQTCMVCEREDRVKGSRFCSDCDDEIGKWERARSRSSARRFWAAPDESEDELTERQRKQQKDSLDTQHESWSKSKSARTFWAAEGDQEQSDAGGGQQAAPAQDPAAAAGGMDPNAMAQAGGGMMPPPGSGAVAPPAAPAPLENQPAEDQLLDMASQAITQMIDRETQEYQQIIDPLTQALQAVQFAQQVESAEHPLDVTPPQGSVNVDPSQAPAAQAMQQQAFRRQAGTSEEACHYCGSGSGQPCDHTCPIGGDQDHVDLREIMFGPHRKKFSPDEEERMRDQLNGEGRYAAQRRHAERQVKRDDILKNAAYVIASRYGLSKQGYRTLLAATFGRRDYEHLIEALKLVPVQDREDPAAHISHLLAAGNPRLNRDAFMKTVMSSKPRDRAGDAWRDGRDRGVAEHGQHDMDEINYRDPEYLKTQIGEPTGETYPMFDRDGNETGRGSVHHRPASRGRLPFDRPRLAGETWKHMPVSDAFEFENDQPQSSDNLTINDLPKMKGAGRHHGGESASGVAGRFQRWQNQQAEKGLNYGETDGALENFITEKKLSPGGSAKLHDQLGLQHPPTNPGMKTPKVVVPKAKNPVTKRGTWGEWEPTKEASFFTRRVPGWKWDDHLSGYISKEGKAFQCSCGQKIAAPSYKSCDCGKIWNVYAIGDSHHLASDSADMFIAREIPVRDNVIMANRKMAGDPEFRGPAADLREGDHVQHLSPSYHGKGVVHAVHPERGMGVTWAVEMGDPVQSWEHPGDLRKIGKAAKQSHQELLAMIDKLADWTKYDSPDPINDMGKKKPASTNVTKPPKDWATRLPKGDPSNKGGTWTSPTIPRKKK